MPTSKPNYHRIYIQVPDETFKKLMTIIKRDPARPTISYVSRVAIEEFVSHRTPPRENKP